MRKYEDGDDTIERSRLLENDEEDGDDDEFNIGNKLLHILDYKTYDYLIYLAVLTIFLCFPLGMVALLFALQAHNNAKMGHYAEAKRRAWTVWAIVSLAIVIDLLIVAIVVVVKTT